MTEVVQLHNRSIVVMDTTLETIRLEKNLSAFRYTVTQQVSESELSEISAPAHLVSVEPHANVTTGLIDDKNLSLLKRGKPWKGRNNLVVMTPALREIFATTTYSLAWDSDLFKTDVMRGAALFDYFKEGGSVDDVVIMDTGSHSLSDRHGDPLPVGVLFDYISNGRITNRNYDLEKAAAILLARPDVDVWAHKGGWDTDKADELRVDGKRTGKVRLATTVEEAVFKIPYYNADGGRSHTLYFVWKPSREDYKAVLEKAGKRGSMEFHKAAFDLDILGLRAGGAAKYEDYYKDDETTYSADED